MELTLIGDYIDARRALELGLVNRVSPPADVLASALDLADRVAANGPLAVTAIKRLVRAAANQPAEEVWAIQDELQPQVFGSEDAKEGAAAFLKSARLSGATASQTALSSKVGAPVNVDHRPGEIAGARRKQKGKQLPDLLGPTGTAQGHVHVPLVDHDPFEDAFRRNPLGLG